MLPPGTAAVPMNNSCREEMVGEMYDFYFTGDLPEVAGGLPWETGCWARQPDHAQLFVSSQSTI